jgi:hypothetical protein
VGGLLQRNPHSEEVEAKLVKPGIPDGRLLVAVVVDRAVIPRASWRRQRSIPGRTRRRTVPPGARSVAPRGAMEVAALVVAVPRTARSTWAAWAAGSVFAGVSRSTRPTRSKAAGATRSAWAVFAGSTGSAGTTRSTGTAWVFLRSTGSTGSAWVFLRSARAAGSAWMFLRSARAAGPTGARTTWSARSTRSARFSVEATLSRCAVTAGRGRRRPSGSRICQTGAHTQGRRTKSAGERSRRNQLLEIHFPPIYAAGSSSASSATSADTK